MKIFFLNGMLILGGYFHGRNNLTYGVDFDQIRWLGVLQVGILEIRNRGFICG